MRRPSRLVALLTLIWLPNPALCAMCLEGACALLEEPGKDSGIVEEVAQAKGHCDSVQPVRDSVQPVRSEAEEAVHGTPDRGPDLPSSEPAAGHRLGHPEAAAQACCTSTAGLEAETVATPVPSSSLALVAQPLESGTEELDPSAREDRRPKPPPAAQLPLYTLHSSLLI